MRGTMEQPMQFIRIENNKLVIEEETANRLSEINSPIHVVGIGGASCSGKSFLLNNFYKGQHGDFQEGKSFGYKGEKITKGIYICLIPQNDGSYSLLLESEGLGDSNTDTMLFLSMLLSSFFFFSAMTDHSLINRFTKMEQTHTNIDHQKLVFLVQKQIYGELNTKRYIVLPPKYKMSPFLGLAYESSQVPNPLFDNQLLQLVQEVELMLSNKEPFIRNGRAIVEFARAYINETGRSLPIDVRSIWSISNEISNKRTFSTQSNNNGNLQKENQELKDSIQKLKDEWSQHECLGSTLQNLISKARQLAQKGEFEAAKMYSFVAKNEGKGFISPSVEAELDQMIEEEAKRMKENRLEELQKETERIQAKLKEASGAEVKLLLQQKHALEKEKQELDKRVQEVQKREKEMEAQAKQFEEQVQQWQKTVKDSAGNDSKSSQSLISNVEAANIQVVKDKQDYDIKLSRAESAKQKLEESEKELKEKIECLQNYLVIVEQEGMLPEVAIYRSLLKSVKRIHNNSVKCFISYAWNPDKTLNAELQAKLTKLKGDLRRAGIEVMLDVDDMEGDTDHYMINGIKDSCRVLLICTPRLKQRQAEQNPNNLQKEYNEAVARQKLDKKFIIPLILEGKRADCVPTDIQNILSLDMTDPAKFNENIISLSNPKGLIVSLLNLERSKLYAELLSGYRARVKLIQMQPIKN